MLPEQLELRVDAAVLVRRVQRLETLLRHVIRHDVVDADLHVVQPGGVEGLDAILGQQEAVRDQTRPSSRAAGCARMRSSSWGWSSGSPPLKATTDVPSSASLSIRAVIVVMRNRRRDFVVLVAVPAVDVAAANRDDVDEERVLRLEQAVQELAPCADAARSCRHQCHQDRTILAPGQVFAGRIRGARRTRGTAPRAPRG